MRFFHYIISFTYMWKSLVAYNYEDDVSYSNHDVNIPVFEYGGKSYYVGELKLTYFEADQFCKNIDMSLVAVHSSAEFEALWNYIKKTCSERKFWTSGSRFLDGENWVWMSTLEVVEFTKWKPGEPNNKYSEQCLEFLSDDNREFLFNDKDCSAKVAFICEKDNHRQLEEDNNYYSKQYQGNKLETVEEKSKKKAKEEAQRKANEEAYKKAKEETEKKAKKEAEEKQKQKEYENELKDEINLGPRKYRFSNIKVTHEEASQTCKRYGLELVSIPNEKKNDFVVNHLIQQYGKSDGKYWTSGTKRYDGKWIWGDHELIAYFNWAPSEPDKDQYCLQVRHTGLWHDQDCDSNSYFLCESVSYTPDYNNLYTYNVHVKAEVKTYD